MPEQPGTEQTTYLTELRCEHCEETSTFAHGGTVISLDRDAPWPDVDHCPKCAAAYPEDLGWAVVETREATIDEQPEIRTDGGTEQAGSEQ